jgi:hypothetical protein
MKEYAVYYKKNGRDWWLDTFSGKEEAEGLAASMTQIAKSPECDGHFKNALFFVVEVHE